ncbi:MAG: hypothetical protein Q9159_006854, partial [Coniocarpon cinnabarinum]
TLRKQKAPDPAQASRSYMRHERGPWLPYAYNFLCGFGDVSLYDEVYPSFRISYHDYLNLERRRPNHQWVQPVMSALEQVFEDNRPALQGAKFAAVKRMSA